MKINEPCIPTLVYEKRTGRPDAAYALRSGQANLTRARPQIQCFGWGYLSSDVFIIYHRPHVLEGTITPKGATYGYNSGRQDVRR